jgi:hypothetical protein
MLQIVKNIHIFHEIGEFDLLAIITKHANKQKQKNQRISAWIHKGT